MDTQQFDPRHRNESLRRQWGVGPEDLVVACVGRLAPEKNLGVLIQAFEALQAGGTRAKLLLVGDGPMRAELQARCAVAVLAGQRSGEDLAAHYASADLFLFPSLTETFGNVTIEAMASGLPVVAFNYAAAAQLIRCGENGVLIPMRDSDAFVSAAVEMASDPVRLRTLGERARESAREAGWDGVILRFESVLAAVIRESETSNRVPFGVTERTATERTAA